MPPPRHVGLNALFFEPGRSAGTETYLRGLVPALAREFPQTRFTVVTTRKGARALNRDGWTSFCSLVQMPSDEGQRLRRLVAEQVRLPAIAGRWDVVHSLASLAPVVNPARSVITLHDVTFFHHATFGAATTLAMKTIVRATARRADALIAISAAARDDIVATLKVSRERIAVVHNGAGRPPSVAPAPGIRERRGLAGRVLLCVAALRPHKNQQLLIRALAHLPDDVTLVLVGHREAYADELERQASERVKILGYVDDAELEALWEIADCAAFPTLAEGFGLPIVEAMERGVPVACSDLPVLREVGGDVPHYFDPHDPVAAAAQIAAAMRAPRVATPSRFTWEEAAHGTFEAYERACTSA